MAAGGVRNPSSTEHGISALRDLSGLFDFVPTPLYSITTTMRHVCRMLARMPVQAYCVEKGTFVLLGHESGNVGF